MKTMFRFQSVHTKGMRSKCPLFLQRKRLVKGKIEKIIGR